MKIIKFKDKKKYKYKRKVSIKNLILKISVGLHDFEKKRRQKGFSQNKYDQNMQLIGLKNEGL